MKLLLKILAAPVIVVLTVFVWVCVLILHISALILGLAGTVVALLGLAVLITYSVKNGIILLVIAFLLSPFGLPMLAVRVLGLLQDVTMPCGISYDAGKRCGQLSHGGWPRFFFCSNM